MLNPAADQPFVVLFERVAGIGPADFLKPSDRDIYLSSERDVVRFRNEVDRLNAREKAARYESTPLPDDEIRRIGSYQQSFNEMVRGEQFVQNVLREKARRRERWVVGLPAIVLARRRHDAAPAPQTIRQRHRLTKRNRAPGTCLLSPQ